MNLKEATQAAKKCLPVIHQSGTNEPCEYQRIIQAGYKYDKKGKQRPFVQLLSKNNNSVTDADPAHCSLKTKEETKECKT